VRPLALTQPAFVPDCQNACRAPTLIAVSGVPASSSTALSAGSPSISSMSTPAEVVILTLYGLPTIQIAGTRPEAGTTIGLACCVPTSTVV
jgi:hypothetical protein